MHNASPDNTSTVSKVGSGSIMVQGGRKGPFGHHTQRVGVACTLVYTTKLHVCTYVHRYIAR